VSAPVLADRYVLAEPLGHGGFAEVYRARDRRGGAQVAVKVLCVADDPGLRARFHQEALLLAGLDHPHVVRALDYAVGDTPRPFLVMEYVRGPSLRRLMQERAWAAPRADGPLVPPATVVAVTRALLAALEYLHARGVVHRDLKPENMLLAPAGPKLVDFGLARQMGAASALTTRFTVLGTPPYMAPEQALGLDVDGRADLYALGVLLYELLTGEWPYPAEWLQAFTAGDSRLTAPPRPAPHPAVPAPLADVLWRLLAIPPAQRYADAAEVSAALAAVWPELAQPSRRTVQAVTGDGRADRVGASAAPASRRGRARASEAAALPLPPILATVPAGVLRVLAERLVERRYAAGEVVLRQGEPGESLHLIAAGQFGVEQEQPDGGQRCVATLGPGDLFGELALLDGEPRSATVRALTAGTTRVLARADFLAVLREHPDVALAVMARLSRIIRGLNRELTETAPRRPRRGRRAPGADRS
jgi:hypothetical protein